MKLRFSKASSLCLILKALVEHHNEGLDDLTHRLIGFTGNICDPSTCKNININSNPIQAYYIYQTTQDTNTGTIPASGNSWTEGWVSSAQ